MRTDGVPDFGVPFDPRTKLPVTEMAGVPRDTWYGDARPGRDFMKNEADIVTGTAEWKVTDGVKLTSKTRLGRTTVDYLASSAEETSISNDMLPSTWAATAHNANRLQQTDLVANQTDVTLKFAFRYTVVAGVEVSREEVSQQSYQRNGANLPSQAVNLLDPQPLSPADQLAATPNNLTAPINRVLDTTAVYLLDTIKLNPQWTLTAGRGSITLIVPTAGRTRQRLIPTTTPTARGRIPSSIGTWVWSTSPFRSRRSTSPMQHRPIPLARNWMRRRSIMVP